MRSPAGDPAGSPLHRRHQTCVVEYGKGIAKDERRSNSGDVDPCVQVNGVMLAASFRSGVDQPRPAQVAHGSGNYATRPVKRFANFPSGASRIGRDEVQDTSVSRGEIPVWLSRIRGASVMSAKNPTSHATNLTRSRCRFQYVKYRI